MIRIEGYKGDTVITGECFANLIGSAVRECYGVAGMTVSGAGQSLLSLIRKKDPAKGVSVKVIDNKLYISLHIAVLYGVNIAAIVKSIVHKVKYVVESATGMSVAKVTVNVDSMIV